MSIEKDEVKTNKPVTLEMVYILIKSMQREISDLRTDVNKLIENNGGVYGRTA